MKWYVCDMDEGVMCIEESRRGAVDWLLRHTGSDKVIARHSYGAGSYEYLVGSSPDDCTAQFIVREDRMVDEGWFR